MIDNKIKNKKSDNNQYLDWIIGLWNGSIELTFNKNRLRLFSNLCDFSVEINQRCDSADLHNQTKINEAQVKRNVDKVNNRNHLRNVENEKANATIRNEEDPKRENAPNTNSDVEKAQVIIRNVENYKMRNVENYDRVQAREKDENMMNLDYPAQMDLDYAAKRNLDSDYPGMKNGIDDDENQIKRLEGMRFEERNGMRIAKTKDLSISIKKCKKDGLSLNQKNVPLTESDLNDDLWLRTSTKLINILYKIDPSILNNLFHIDYPNLWNRYWFTGFLETNLTYLSINLNNLTSHTKIEAEGMNVGNNGSRKDWSPSQASQKEPKLTDVKWEFHLYDKNLENLLILNKILKGKILLMNDTYKLIMKLNLGEVKKIMKYLNEYPFITIKHIKYRKIRKIYEICKTKKNYYNKGMKQILTLYS